MAQQVKDATIRLRALDGTWETAGTDRSRGIYAENVELNWDTAGSKTASFDLRRSPRTPWPDIAAFTDVEIEVAAVQVWKGRVQSTPTRDNADRAMSVQCEGLQAHLDDDVLVPAYVHTKLSDWKDMRSPLTADLTSLTTAPQVGTSGVITLAWPANVATNGRCGVVLDLGPGATATTMRFDWSITDNPSSTRIFYAGSGDTASGILESTAQSSGTGPATVANSTHTAPVPRRYWFLFFDANSHTPTDDEVVKITGVRVFASSTYDSGGASVLTATQIVTDTIARGTTLLDPDRSLIATTAFAIPDFFSSDYRSTREVIDAANAFHDYIAKIDERGRPVFQPKPSAPLIEVGEHTALEVEDSSANSGGDIYNRCLVTGQTATSDPITVERTAGQQPGAVLIPIATPAPTNPSFDVDASSWTSSSGTITRRTASFHSTPACGQWVSGPFDTLSETFTGTFKAGVTYVLQFWVSQVTGFISFRASLGTSTDYGVANCAGGSGFAQYSVSWTPDADSTSATFRIETALFSSVTWYVDTLALFKAAPTLVDRRGFRRSKVLQVSSPLDTAGVVGAQLGDTYLSNHRTAQFKGTASITGPTTREILTGKSIPPEQLGMRTGELLRFNDRVDPDTGAVGRDGRISSVKYTLADDKATVTIDNTSQNFEALLARLAVIQGAGQ